MIYFAKTNWKFFFAAPGTLIRGSKRPSSQSLRRLRGLPFKLLISLWFHNGTISSAFGAHSIFFLSWQFQPYKWGTTKWLILTVTFCLCRGMFKAQTICVKYILSLLRDSYNNTNWWSIFEHLCQKEIKLSQSSAKCQQEKYVWKMQQSVHIC